jgi:hypothetical protein
MHMNTLYLHKSRGYPYSALPQHHKSPIYIFFLTPVLKPSKFRTSPTNLNDRKKGIRCNKSLSVGSEIHPSIGTAFSGHQHASKTYLHARHNLWVSCPGYKPFPNPVQRQRGL